MRRGILAGGTFIVDFVKTIDRYPAEQTLANIHREYAGSGGAPYNLLLDLAKLGCDQPLAAVGCIGDDDAGKLILDELSEHSIDVTGIRIAKEAPTSYTLVMVAEGTGRRTFFHQRGANTLLSPGDFAFESFTHFHFGYPLLLDTMDAMDPEYGTAAARVLAEAKRAGLTTSIDLVSEDSDRFRRVVPAALRHSDIAFMNEFEVFKLTGVEVVRDGRADPEAMVQARGRIEFDGLLALHWAEGSAVCDREGRTVWQGSVRMPRERIASLTGSGDAFAAGFLLSWLRRASLQDSLRLGVCAAGASITGYTCTDAMTRECDCLALGDTYGFLSCP